MPSLRASLLFLLILLLTPLPAAASEQPLPELSGDLYVLGERHNDYAESLIQNLRRYGKLIHDPVVTDFMDRLSDRIASASSTPIKLRLFVVDDDSINAFAMPPNYVGVNTGLILAARSEDELAAVIAHEVAHLTLHHLDRAMEEAGKLGPATAGAIIAALILGAYDPTFAEAAIATTIAANLQSQLSFSRSSEQEADRSGIQILARAGYRPEAMAQFFSRLLENETYNAKAPVFIRTHPLTADRVSETASLAQQLQHLPPAAAEPPDPVAFALFQIQIARQTGFPLTRIVHADTPAPARRYVRVLDDLRAGRRQAAIATLQRLTREDSPRIPYLLTLSEAYKMEGDYEAAIGLLRRYLDYYPDNVPLITYYADMLIEEGRPQDAVRRLERHIKYGLREPALFLTLSKAYAALGRQGRAHVMLSNYYFLLGEYKLSLKELTLSLSYDDLENKEKKLIQKKIQSIADNLG